MTLRRDLFLKYLKHKYNNKSCIDFAYQLVKNNVSDEGIQWLNSYLKLRLNNSYNKILNLPEPYIDELIDIANSVGSITTK